MQLAGYFDSSQDGNFNDQAIYGINIYAVFEFLVAIIMYVIIIIIILPGGDQHPVLNKTELESDWLLRNEKRA